MTRGIEEKVPGPLGGIIDKFYRLTTGSSYYM
jgi:hypothetical protein